MAQPLITILLSTYNGERYLAAQLQSFAGQSYKNWVLHWRDDGSTDRTIAIMQEFSNLVGAARCVQSRSSGPHLGASPSFLTLLSECSGAEAIAFADQDDVWLPKKLLHAATNIGGPSERPVLYCARQYLVDEALQGAHLSVAHRAAPGFPASLTQNIANGNTLVMNGAAARLVATMGRPEGTVHDWWSYIVVSACGGRIIFDERPAVLYRLHKNNLIGRSLPLWARARAAMRRGPATFMTMMRRHADTLADQPSRLSPQARQDLNIIHAGLHGGVMHRLRALRCGRFRRRTMLENLLFAYWFITDGLVAVPRLMGQSSLPGWTPQEGPAAE
jgi:glycosyltransferase involved in cell wall biosynthesis